MNSFGERYVDNSNMPYDTFRSSMYEAAINYNRDLYNGISDLKKRKELRKRFLDAYKIGLHETNYRDILRCIYLKLYKYGYKEISLRMDELNNYIPKIEFIFNTWMINSDDLFVKMPVQEIYNQYKNYLIDIFINNGLGYFNEIYDAIILNITDYYVNKQLEEMHHYEKMINECCEVIINKDTYNNMYVHTKKIIKK